MAADMHNEYYTTVLLLRNSGLGYHRILPMIEWMRTYNQGMSDDKKVAFMG
jgi:hypothetical protein